MSPRPRKRGQKDLPPNLYAPSGTSTVWRYRNPVTGSWHSMGSVKKAAVEAAITLNLRLQNAPDYIGRVFGTQAVAEVVSRFRAEYLPERRLAPRTLQEHEYKLRQYVARWGERNIGTITLADLDAFMRMQKRDPYIKHRALLQQLWGFARSIGAVKENIADALMAKLPAEKQRKRWALEQFETMRALAAPWLQIAMDLAVVTLQRREDLVSMKFADIVDGRLLVQQHKTGARLAIAIGSELAAVLSRARQTGIHCPMIIHRKPERYRASATREHHFAVTGEYLSKAIAELRDSTGVCEGMTDAERPTLHEFRSLGAHLYREAGFDEAFIQALLGHADERMTEHYLDGHKVVWEEVTAR